MGDFLGFTFGGVHSSDLGITRVSGGDRYEEQLHPEIKDRTTEVPGLNGEYYFGSDFGPKSFDIEIAFDHLTEEQFKKLRKIFGTKEIKQLIFDERPYKYYMAKLENPIELSYICFDEPKKRIVGEGIGQERYGVRKVEKIVSETVVDEETGEETIVETTIRVPERIYPYEKLEGTERIYKGEGKITFKAHFPFAKSVYKQLPVTEEESDWVISSGILSTSQRNEANIDINTPHPTESNVRHIHVYNPGDLSTGFRLYCPFTNHTYDNPMSVVYFIKSSGDWVEQARLIFKPITKITEQEVGFLIDTNTCLVTGVSEFYNNSDGNARYTTNGQLYNRYIDKGRFFKIQPTELNGTEEALIAIINGNEDIEIFYDYLYF